MKTVKKKVTLYLDMYGLDSPDQEPIGNARWYSRVNHYLPELHEGQLRYKVEIEIDVPLKHEVQDGTTSAVGELQG